MTAIPNIEIVPHLTTALTGPFQKIERNILDHQVDIEAWFRRKQRQLVFPFYTSVDLRNAAFKIAPIDTNLFPSGFNNLNPAFEPLCIQAIQSSIEQFATPIDRILIVPENHSRNLFYLDHLYALKTMIAKAGFDTRIGTIDSKIEQPQTLLTNNNKQIIIEPIKRTADKLSVSDFIPDLILLNNDLSSGIPNLLQGVTQPITPVPALGWSTRLKSNHFSAYQRIAQEFAHTIGIDPWLIDPMFRNCGKVNFMQRAGLDCLTQNTTTLLEKIKAKYIEHNINCEPFVIVKADAGTYGMGVMTVHHADKIKTLNRKQRSHMAKTKEGQTITQVIIQEGVYTHETWGNAESVAEPVVYLIGHHVVGGFYRVHAKRATNENLNAPGMHFERLAFADCCLSPPDTANNNTMHTNRFYTYGVIARLAGVAAAEETSMLAQQPQQ